MRHLTRITALILMTGLVAAGAQANKPPGAKLTVALVDFDAGSAGAPELGKQIGDALTALLSAEDGFTLVDRASLGKALQELELNQTGLVSPENATKIGRLVGAKILITGKAFPLDKQLYITAKIIGTETTLVEGVLVKGERQDDLGKLVADLAEKVAARLRRAGPKLVAGEESDAVPGLIARLKAAKLPKVAVKITERHITQAPAARIDPAVETEVRMLLQQAGFTIVEGSDQELAKAGVDLIISGEAFSEAGSRIGNLASCVARVEIKMMPWNGATVLHSDRETVRAVDLSENIAGKTALQKGGRAVGIRLLEYFVKQQPATRPSEKVR